MVINKSITIDTDRKEKKTPNIPFYKKDLVWVKCPCRTESKNDAISHVTLMTPRDRFFAPI